MAQGRLLVGAMAIALLFAGCIAATDSGSGTQGASLDVSDRYKDADARYTNSVGGIEEASKSINVPVGASRLLVKAAYAVGGNAEFVLKSPLQTVEKRDAISGGKTTETESWYSTTNPTPGTWTFSIDVRGGADYAFGFYY